MYSRYVALTGGVATLAAAIYIPLAPALRCLPRKMTASGDLGVCRFNFVICHLDNRNNDFN